MKSGSEEGGPASGWFRAAVVLFVAVAAIGAATVDHYGMSWDEPMRFEGGDAKLAYYQALFAGEETPDMNDRYPGLFDLTLAVWRHAFPSWGHRVWKGHVLSLLFGLAGLLAVWRTAAFVGGERAGFWALALLATLPRYYGHMFFNPKDIPLAGTYALGVWALVRACGALPRPGWRHAVWVGLAAGLAMATRVAGFLILVYFGAFAGMAVLAAAARHRRRFGRCPWRAAAKRAFAFWLPRGVVSGAVALGAMLPFWPAAHGNPFAHVGRTAESVQSFGWGGHVLMHGRFFEAADLPLYYLPYWIGATTPEPTLLLLLAAAAAGIGALARRRALPGRRLGPTAVVAVAFLFPSAYIVGSDPELYDGLRHALFTLPPMAACAALGLEGTLRALERRGKGVASRALQYGAGCAAAVVAVEMVSLHPYQYVYFNQVAGGLKGAYMRDETDYWGLSHREAAAWLNRYVERIDPDGDRRFTVYQPYSTWMLGAFLAPRVETSRDPSRADFYVAVTRYNFHLEVPNAELLKTIDRQGVPLCFIMEMPARIRALPEQASAQR